MLMQAYLLDWISLLLRWLHLTAGIAWIGASFYFIMLDNSLRPARHAADTQRGVAGEIWAVHGGGFYCSQKFPTGPLDEPLSDQLHWSKWEAYTTWLSGLGLMLSVYWLHAATYLVDPAVLALAPSTAVIISIVVLGIGWLSYDGLCRLLSYWPRLLGGSLILLILGNDWLLFHLFSARAAYINLGAMLGTIMTANVFFHIIPGQKKMIAQIRAGQSVDRRWGLIGRQRSVHNTYFTLPVLFIMISNHYPMTYTNPRGWLVLAGIMLVGVWLRQFFVLRLRAERRWWLPIASVALIIGLIMAIAPSAAPATNQTVSYTEIHAILEQRCLPCHAAHPSQEGFAQAPKGILFDTPDQVQRYSAAIAQAVQSHYMPLGNLTHISEHERSLIARWYQLGALSDPKPLKTPVQSTRP